MCGIAGIFDSRGSFPLEYGRNMLDVLTHRGPDDSGMVLFDTRNGDLYTWPGENPDLKGGDLLLGHVRLSIIDLSRAGHQPMGTPDGKVWIVYNGEVFNYMELRRLLEAKGYEFRSRTDTEVVLYGYREFGRSVLERLRGFFAFCIYDTERGELFMARDRIGKKPFKYYWDGRYFAFASEIKALLQLSFVPRIADAVAIDRYLAYRYIPPPLTGIKRIYKLPAGCSMTFSLRDPGKGPEVERYWLPLFRPKKRISFKEAVDEGMVLLMESVSMRLISDVPLGVFLSGGIDSSLIVAMLKEGFNNRIRTFTVGFRQEGFDERPFARSVAEALGTDHTELEIEPRPERDLREIVWHFDEPFGDPSAIPSFYLSKAASSEVKVVLNGDGGDELFCGYKRYAIHRRNSFLDHLPRTFHRMARALSEAVPFVVDKKSFWGRMGRLLESSSDSFINTYPLRFSGLPYRIRRALYSVDGLMAERGWPEGLLSLLEMTGVDTPMERLLAIDQFTYLPEDILAKSDLSGMAHSLEARSPLLDHRFVEWANTLPISYKYGKRLLKAILQGRVPPECIERKKAGFNPPMADWARGILRDHLREYLISGHSPLWFLKRTVIERIFYLHMEGKVNLGEQLWLLLILAVWFEINRIESME